MGSSARVSIVIPVYNGSDYLDEAIQSALRQTYRNTEILVVNDGSDDAGATEAIARKYEDRIRYFQKPNGGVATALNLAVDEMTGEYFSWLSHDDLYLPEKIEVQMDALAAQHDPRTVSYCDYAVFRDDPRRATAVTLAAGPPSEFRYWLTTNNVLHGCTLLIPRLAFEECGRFAARLLTTQDYDLWFRMAKCFRFVHLPRTLVLARSHANQGSRLQAATAHRECNALLTGFSAELTESELIGRYPPGMLPRRLATLSASMFRRGFLRAGFATIPQAIARLRSRGMRSVLLYVLWFPPRALASMLASLLTVLVRTIVR